MDAGRERKVALSFGQNRGGLFLFATIPCRAVLPFRLGHCPKAVSRMSQQIESTTKITMVPRDVFVS